MSTIEILFWVCFIIVFYTFIGYGLIMFLIIRIKRVFRKKPITFSPDFEPFVTLIIPAYNEEEFINKKIENTLELDYPADKLKIFFVTDGSQDRTTEIIRPIERFNLFHENERRGKTAAMNRVVKHVTTPIIIFCDANTLLNKQAIKNIVRHYEIPNVGGIAGEKKILTSVDELAAGAGESLYWKYESTLKRFDSELYSVVGAAGELFSVRTELYEDLQEDTILDDFMISLRVNLKGYRVIYEPEAFALETASESMSEEQKRKIRICAGGIQSILRLLPLFNLFKHPWLTFEYISHRVLRWTITPFCLIGIFFFNIILLDQDFIYKIIFFFQIMYYLIALSGWYFANKNIKIKGLYVPYYFLFMNISVIMGMWRFLNKRQSAVWERANRKLYTSS